MFFQVMTFSPNKGPLLYLERVACYYVAISNRFLALMAVNGLLCWTQLVLSEHVVYFRIRFCGFVCQKECAACVINVKGSILYYSVKTRHFKRRGSALRMSRSGVKGWFGLAD